MPVISEQPSVDDLIARMESEQRQLEALKQGVVHGVPRPPLMERLLMLAASIMLVTVTILIGTVGLSSIRMADAIRIRRAEDAATERRLPPDHDLRDPMVFERAAIRHPYDVALLYAGLGRSYLADGKAKEAVAAFAEARQHVVSPLPVDVTIDEVEALILAGHNDQARRCLLDVDLSRSDQTQRARIVRLMASFPDSPVPLPGR